MYTLKVQRLKQRIGPLRWSDLSKESPILRGKPFGKQLGRIPAFWRDAFSWKPSWELTYQLPLSVLLSRWCSWIPFPCHGGICDVMIPVWVFFFGCFHDVKTQLGWCELKVGILHVKCDLEDGIPGLGYVASITPIYRAPWSSPIWKGS